MTAVMLSPVKLKAQFSLNWEFISFDVCCRVKTTVIRGVSFQNTVLYI